MANYSPAVDYFPDKTTVRYATQFAVTYHGHYKKLVFAPNIATHESEEYLLVQCGTPVPPHAAATRVVMVPGQRFILANLAFVSTVDRLGLLDSLIGVSSMNGVSHPGVIERHKNGRIGEVGTGVHSSVEMAIASDADLLFTFYSAWPNYNTHPKLWEVGIKGIPTADHFERDTLGRSEWLKFVAVFFNREREAEDLFQPAAERYERLKTLTQGVAARPEVLTGFASGRDIWNLNGAKNFFASLIWDAGGHYFWNDDLALSLVPVDFERVLDGQRESLFYISRSVAAKSRRALASRNPLMESFRAFENNEVWSPDKNTATHRRPPWMDQSLDRPDVVLKDLIAILHPELVPSYEPFYIRKVD